MTLIIALKHKGKVYLGGDAAAVGGYDRSPTVEPKVFKNGKYMIGYTTSFRMGQILQHMKLPVPPVKELTKFMVTTFIESITEEFTKRDYDWKENGVNFIAVIHNRIFEIENGLQVHEKKEISAVGCAYAYALGAITACEIVDPKERMLKTFSIAEIYSAGIMAPYTIISD
jgi:ATP-dependent protease HslVU (ClpYQ) peptidase subunit